MSDTEAPQGILCVMKRREYSEADILAGAAPLIMVLEDIQDPGNLGTIMRAGEAAGMDHVLLSQKCVDIFNSQQVRSRMGYIYRLPFLHVDSL